MGVTGFGGPPTHIVLLRQLCVEREGRIPADEFEDAIAACNLLPGPASTQLAIYCAGRVGGLPGALVGGAGAGAAVSAVALRAAADLALPSCRRVAGRTAHARWLAYAAAAALGAALAGPWLVLVLVGCGLAELAVRGVAPRALLPALPHAAGLRLAGVDGAQGGGALVRRRVRDRAARAVRRSLPVSLDDRRPVPRRRRPRPGDAGPGRLHGRGRRLRGRRHRRVCLPARGRAVRGLAVRRARRRRGGAPGGPPRDRAGAPPRRPCGRGGARPRRRIPGR